QMCLGPSGNVDERAPPPAAAVQKEPLAQERVLDERIDDEVEPHARAVSVYRALTQNDRYEARICFAHQELLRLELRARVRAARHDLRRLVEQPVAHAVVNRSARTEGQPADASSLARD